MKLGLKKIAFLFLLIVSSNGYGKENVENFFEIDMEAPLPSYEELYEKYSPPPVYDKKYEFTWNIGTIFDKEFYNTIQAYGSSDKRLKKENEDVLFTLITTAPKEIYPYIGPYLHTVPNISPKILNLPGIKETKGKFPTRIAPQMKDIPNLEFLSPHMYFLLMPEIWPENLRMMEGSFTPIKNPKTVYRPEFYKRIHELVPVKQFYPNNQEKKKISKSDLRTVSPNKDSALTTADIQAFVRTIKGVNDFVAQPGMKLRLFSAGQLLDAYENDIKGYSGINALKDIVHPCQRFVQKVRILGEETNLELIVGKEAFNLNEWAYTCDKTIKAYRKSQMSSSVAASVIKAKNREYEKIITQLDSFNAEKLQAVKSLEVMYHAPINDVLEAIKNRKLLKEEFSKAHYEIGGHPIALH